MDALFYEFDLGFDAPKTSLECFILLGIRLQDESSRLGHQGIAPDGELNQVYWILPGDKMECPLSLRILGNVVAKTAMRT